MSNASNPVQARCPHCGRRFHYDPAGPPKWLPFCRERCQWADLGRWLDGEYRVSRPLSTSDEEQDD